MDSFSLTTPSMLFPAVSLLMLAYTNRFLALSGIIRQMHEHHHRAPDEKNLLQLGNFRRRVWLIRWMQAFGLISLLVCIVSMVCMVFGLPVAALSLFVISLATMVLSLGLCLFEVLISDTALNILLSDIEKDIHILTQAKS